MAAKYEHEGKYALRSQLFLRNLNDSETWPSMNHDINVKNTFISEENASDLLKGRRQQKAEEVVENLHVVDDRVRKVAQRAEEEYLEKKKTAEKWNQMFQKEKEINDQLASIKTSKIMTAVSKQEHFPAEKRLEMLDRIIETPKQAQGGAHSPRSPPMRQNLDDTIHYEDEIPQQMTPRLQGVPSSRSDKNQGPPPKELILVKEPKMSVSIMQESLVHNHADTDNVAPRVSGVWNSGLRQSMADDKHKHNHTSLSRHCQACESHYKSLMDKSNALSSPTKNLYGLDVNKILVKAKMLLSQKKLQQAEALIDDSISKDLIHADLFYMGGETKRLLRKLRAAEVYLLKSMQFELHSPYVYQSLALTYIDLDHPNRAVPLLKHFLQFSENDEINFELGKCLCKIGNFIEAAVYFSKAIELNPMKADYYLYRADTYEALGFIELSVSDYRAFRKLKPTYRVEYETLAKNLTDQGNDVEAKYVLNFIRKVEL